MPTNIYVEIEMPVYLKKYLLAQSENKKEPLHFCIDHDYNILIRQLTTNRRVEKLQKCDETVRILLPFSRRKDAYFYNNIGFHNRVYFREQVRLDFYYDFRLFVKERIMAGIQRKIAIEQFFLLHNINEDDIKYESFYRNFTRFNNKKALKFNAGLTSRLLPQMCL